MIKSKIKYSQAKELEKILRDPNYYTDFYNVGKNLYDKDDTLLVVDKNSNKTIDSGNLKCA